MADATKNTFRIGTVLNDKWVILELIGEGGMGEVYRVHQLNLKRDIAIKILSAKFLQEIEDSDYEAEAGIERFRREVELNGVVWGDKHIWLILGEVKPGYAPIGYSEGKFHMRLAEHASCPVLRVTGYGAMAFTHFYGHRLMTEEEWYYVATVGNNTRMVDESADDEMNATGGAHVYGTGWPQRLRSAPRQVLPVPSPVILLKPDVLGIKGMNENMGEWTLRAAGASQDDKKEAELVILGDPGDGKENKQSPSPGIQRHPWEAFAGTGFRCVLGLTAHGHSHSF